MGYILKDMWLFDHELFALSPLMMNMIIVEKLAKWTCNMTWTLILSIA